MGHSKPCGYKLPLEEGQCCLVGPSPISAPSYHIITPYCILCLSPSEITWVPIYMYMLFFPPGMSSTITLTLITLQHSSNFTSSVTPSLIASLQRQQTLVYAPLYMYTPQLLYHKAMPSNTLWPPWRQGLSFPLACPTLTSGRLDTLGTNINWRALWMNDGSPRFPKRNETLCLAMTASPE